MAHVCFQVRGMKGSNGKKKRTWKVASGSHYNVSKGSNSAIPYTCGAITSLDGTPNYIYVYAWKDYEVLNFLSKKFLGLHNLIRSPIIRGKVISVTIKARCMGIQQAWPSNQFLFLPLNHIMHGKTQSKPPRASTLCYFPKGQKVPISQKQFFIRHHSHIHKVELLAINPFNHNHPNIKLSDQAQFFTTFYASQFCVYTQKTSKGTEWDHA